MVFEERLKQELESLASEKGYGPRHPVVQKVLLAIKELRNERTSTTDKRPRNNSGESLADDALVNALRSLSRIIPAEGKDTFLFLYDLSRWELDQINFGTHRIMWLLYWKIITLQANPLNAPDLDNL